MRPPLPGFLCFIRRYRKGMSDALEKGGDMKGEKDRG